MCRYGQSTYKNHFACFRCRKAFKRYDVSVWPPHLRPADGVGPVPCPVCAERMADLGLDFEPPPADDREHWGATEALYRRGFGYHACGCGGPGYRPSRRVDVPAFLPLHPSARPGEALAERFANRRKG